MQQILPHSILLRRLRESYGISDVVLAWITSYLTDRQQSVCHGGTLSAQEYIKFGVPQGSVLGPLLFVLYTADLVSLIADHCLHSHLYADDTQVYGWSPPSDASALQVSMSHCTVYHTSMYRPWRRVNVDEFKVALRQSTLCADTADGEWVHLGLAGMFRVSVDR